ncbi:MAG: PKD domain-containing protein, partial [Phaeodactylibacter sp.]|nr:PKD domain-containing protein [Phaeodactylibacter sp.]
MKHACSTALFLLCTAAFLHAQPAFRGTAITPASPENFSRHFSEYHLFKADAGALSRYAKSSQGVFRLELQLGGAYEWVLELEGVDIRSEDYRLTALTDRGEEQLPRSENKTYRGRALGPQGGEARFTLDEHFVYGFIESGDETFYLEPAWHFDPGLEKGVYLAYPASAVINTDAFTCGWEGEPAPQARQAPAPQAERFVLACYEADVALAADYSMVQRYGSVSGVESFMLGVLNNVQSNYDNEFTHQITFTVATIYVSSCSGCDPWTGSANIDFLLDDFTGWGNAGGFGANFDLASLWSNRDFIGDAIGIAWVGAACTDGKYNVLQSFSTNSAQLRVLQAHEFGHNFDARHDAPGSNFIMAPTVTTSNTWSNASLSAINSFINALTGAPGCLSSCGGAVGPPVAALAGSPTYGCAPLAVNFSDLSTGQVEFVSWQFPGGSPATSSNTFPTVTYNTPGAYDVILTVSNSGGDNTVVMNDYIVVEPPPVAGFSVMVDGMTVYFDNTSSNAQDFQWDFGDGSFSNLPSPSHTYSADGLYEVVLAAGNGCGAATFEQFIVVETPMQAAFSAGAQQGCAGARISFSDQTIGLPVSWNWTFEGGTPATSTSPNPTVTYETPGVYAVTLSTANALGTVSHAVQQQYIEIFPEPVAGYTAQYFSGGLTVEFNNTSSGADSWFWDFGDGYNSAARNPTHTYTTEGAYPVSLTAYGPCGEDVAIQAVEVFSPPTAAFSANVLSGCAPLSVQFSNGSSPNATYFQWSFQGGTPATSTLPDPVVTFNTAGTYTVRLIASNPAGSDTNTQSVVIENGPQSAFTIDYTPGETEAAFINQSGNADDIRWDFGNGDTSAEENPVYDFGSDGTYLVSLIASNACGADTSNQEVTVITAPTAAFELGATSGCAPFTVQASDLSSGNTTAWSWSAPGATPEASTERNPSFTFTAAGTYTISLEAANAAGASLDSTEIFVNSGPAPGFTFQLNGLEAQFSNTSANSLSYVWEFGDGAGSEEASPTHSFDEPGEYIVTLTAANECGETAIVDTVTIDLAAPVANFTVSGNQGCAPLTVTFENSSENADSYSWTFPGGTPASSTEPNPTVVYETPGTYTVTLMAINAAGSGALTRQNIIVVGGAPQGSFDYLSNEATVTFTNTTENADSYLWLFGDGNSS